MSVPAPVLSSTSEFSKVAQTEIELPRDVALVDTYKLDKVADEIKEERYLTVALQFPDTLIPQSTHIASLLQSRLEDSKVFILADTSYSPCCVDEIAAQHVKAEAIVHFGHACLNPVKSLPVIYVFGGYEVSIENVEEMFRGKYTDLADKIILMADPQYAHIIEPLRERLSSDYPGIVPTALKVPTDGSVVFPEINTYGYTKSLLPSRLHSEIQGLSDYKIFHITAPPPSSSLILHLTTLCSDVTLLEVFSRDQVNITTPHVALMKRYRYVSIARTAGTIGILINTLSLKNVNEVLKTVQTWITQAGKKFYTFVVGKPNVAKLANFEVVDIWVVLGCPIGGIIVDCDDYYKPIITPYELNLALKAEVMWTGQWLLDFESVLELVSDEPSVGDDDEDDDEPVWDPVSGRLVSNSKPLRRLKHVDVDIDDRNEDASSGSKSKDLIERTQSQLTIRNTVSTAADVLQNRFTWQGLSMEYQEGSEGGATVEEGRKGIARGYKVDQDEDRS